MLKEKLREMSFNRIEEGLNLEKKIILQGKVKGSKDLKKRTKIISIRIYG